MTIDPTNSVDQMYEMYQRTKFVSKRDSDRDSESLETTLVNSKASDTELLETVSNASKVSIDDIRQQLRQIEESQSLSQQPIRKDSFS